MKAKSLLAGAVAVAALTGVAAEANTVKGKSCGNLSAMFGNVRAYNVSCATARKVASADSKGKKSPGWTCTYKQYPGGATATCTHKGRQKVTYQTAD